MPGEKDQMRVDTNEQQRGNENRRQCRREQE